MEGQGEQKLNLVTTKPCFGLPTACPNCLPVYLYLKLSQTPFHLSFHSTFPDSDQIPYVESGLYVAYNNEKGGVIECLRTDGIANLDSDFDTIPEWVSLKAMISGWLADALMYEFWVATDKRLAQTVYYSDLPWPIGSILYFKQVYAVKQHLGITNENAERIEAEIYKRATQAYGALSTRLGEDSYLFGNRPSSLDALFLGHVLITLQALPEASILSGRLLSHSNLVRYSEKLNSELVGDGSVWSSVPSASLRASSSMFKQGHVSYSSPKPKSKPKKERTAEEKKFRSRAKYFLGVQLISIIVFLSLFSGSGAAEVELDEEDDGIDYY